MHLCDSCYSPMVATSSGVIFKCKMELENVLKRKASIEGHKVNQRPLHIVNKNKYLPKGESQESSNKMSLESKAHKARRIIGQR